MVIERLPIAGRLVICPLRNMPQLGGLVGSDLITRPCVRPPEKVGPFKVMGVREVFVNNRHLNGRGDHQFVLLRQTGRDFLLDPAIGSLESLF